MNKCSTDWRSELGTKQTLHVPIQPNVEQYGSEQNAPNDIELHVQLGFVPNYSGGQVKWKLDNQSKHLTAKATEKEELKKQ